MIKRLHPELPWDQSDGVYHQIGIFIVKFSEVIATLRRGVVELTVGAPLYQEIDLARRLDAVFDKMTADPIRVAFFSLCADVVSFDADEVKIRDVMNASVQRLTERRNEIAHADWDIGWMVHDSEELVPPSARKIYASVKKGVSRREVYNVKSLHNLVWEVLETYRSATSFVSICVDRSQNNSTVRLTDRLEVVTHDPIGKMVKVKGRGEAGSDAL